MEDAVGVQVVHAAQDGSQDACRHLAAKEGRLPAKLLPVGELIMVQ